MHILFFVLLPVFWLDAHFAPSRPNDNFPQALLCIRTRALLRPSESQSMPKLILTGARCDDVLRWLPTELNHNILCEARVACFKLSLKGRVHYTTAMCLSEGFRPAQPSPQPLPACCLSSPVPLSQNVWFSIWCQGEIADSPACGFGELEYNQNGE